MLPRACLSGKRYSFNLLTRARARATWPNTRCQRRHPNPLCPSAASHGLSRRPRRQRSFRLLSGCRSQRARVVAPAIPHLPVELGRQQREPLLANLLVELGVGLSHEFPQHRARTGISCFPCFVLMSFSPSATRTTRPGVQMRGTCPCSCPCTASAPRATCPPAGCLRWHVCVRTGTSGASLWLGAL